MHIFDTAPGPKGTSFLFRSNMPTNSTSFDYTALRQAFVQRAREANLTLGDFFLIDISLNNDLEGGERGLLTTSRATMVLTHALSRVCS